MGTLREVRFQCLTTAQEECVGGGNNEGQQEDLGMLQRKEEGRDRRLQAKTW